MHLQRSSINFLYLPFIGFSDARVASNNNMVFVHPPHFLIIRINKDRLWDEILIVISLSDGNNVSFMHG